MSESTSMAPQERLSILQQIAKEMALRESQVTNSIQLLVDEECTIPFVARYRKEMTQSLDEVALKDIREKFLYMSELVSLRAKCIKVIEEQASRLPEVAAKLPDLRKKFAAATTKQEIEDLYLPYKPKRRTRAQIAREKGLEKLLKDILSQRDKLEDLTALATEFISPPDSQRPVELRVKTILEALQGASDILAEDISEVAENRAAVRELSWKTGRFTAKVVEDAATQSDDATSPTPVAEAGTKRAAAGRRGPKQNDRDQEKAKYANYFDYSEPLANAPSHRIMAVRRGEAEKFLRVSIDVDTDLITKDLNDRVIGLEKTTGTVREWLVKTVEDAYKRLIGPSIETEIRLSLKTRAEEEAIKVFTRNLQNLLMLPPIPGKAVLGVDPGIRTGSKLAVVNETGKYIVHATIYPDFGKTDGPKSAEAKATIIKMIKDNSITCIAVGNGTGSREVDQLLAAAIKEGDLKNVKRITVNESGASVYSADDIAREEFPDLDPTIRSAISIARRLQDPLAELVKIDPRSIGVGQYQHDVTVTKLKSSLEDVVASCVNKVGVNLNTASFKLLSYVSGIGPTLAKNIVQERDQRGKFKTRNDLLAVPNFGPKAFVQAAGFLRVAEGTNPLDNSSVHPERYGIVEKIMADIGKSLPDVIGNSLVVSTIPWEKYVTTDIGLPTLRDISQELVKPGRDPREDGIRLFYSDEISEISHLKVGMALKGTVTNVTNFGAFVDIGVHQDGLVHISELSDNFVQDPASVIAVGEIVDVRVTGVDVERKRISLSRKSAATAGATASASGSGATARSAQQQGHRPAAQRPSFDQGPRRDGPRRPDGGSSNSRPFHGRDNNTRSNAPAAQFGPTRSQPGKGSAGRPREPEKSFTADDLMSKFNKK